jgi:hypothetical protein
MSNFETYIDFELANVTISVQDILLEDYYDEEFCRPKLTLSPGSVANSPVKAQWGDVLFV